MLVLFSDSYIISNVVFNTIPVSYSEKKKEYRGQSDMRNILYVLGAIDNGGIEKLVANILDNIDENDIHIEIAYHGNAVDEERVNNFELLSSRCKYIYRIPSFNTINAIPYRRWWKKFLSERYGQYDIVHLHYTDSAFCFMDLLKKQGARIIAHTHNTLQHPLTIGAVFSLLLTYPTRSGCDFFLGCSKKAIEQIFGKKVAASNKSHVFINGINTSANSFSIEKREGIRRKYNAGNKIIIGHVGRFSVQKNHKKIIEVFDSFHSRHPESELWLIGSGELMETTQSDVRKRNLDEYVRFIGITDDVNSYMCAMDLFLFPSSYEGFGIVLIEAQSSGLPCLVADESIQPEADARQNLLYRVSLNAPDSVWSDKAFEIIKDIKRQDHSCQVKTAGYDMKDGIRWLQDFYLK